MIENIFFLTDEAIEDIKQISIWYADKSEHLGDRFQIKIFQSIHVICQFPLAHFKQGKHNVVRRLIMKDFPYKIFYDPSTTPIRIIAVIHASRSAKYIRGRIK